MVRAGINVKMANMEKFELETKESTSVQELENYVNHVKVVELNNRMK
jgi:hypothetical protein